MVLVSGDREHAEQARGTVAAVLAPMGLRLSAAKTLITSIDEGLDFLGWRIQRHRQPGGTRQYVYTYPAKKALRAICRKVKGICRGTSVNQPLSVLLYRLNPVLRGWCAYFRPGVSSKTFRYLAAIAWPAVALDAPAQKVQALVDVGDQGLLRRQAQPHPGEHPGDLFP